MTARALSLLCRPLLILGCLIPSTLAWLRVEGLSRWTADGVCFYALTLLTFMVFPAKRRNDLTLGLLAAVIMLDAPLRLIGVAPDYAALVASMGGVGLCHLASHCEALRRRMRDDPWYPAFAPAVGDRRQPNAPLNVKAVRR